MQSHPEIRIKSLEPNTFLHYASATKESFIHEETYVDHLLQNHISDKWHRAAEQETINW